MKIQILPKNFITQKSPGVSLIEILLVIAAMSLIVLLLANIPNSVSLINKSRNTSLAEDIASRQIEVLRKTNYNSLFGESTFTDMDLASLPESEAFYEILDCEIDICGNAEAKQVHVTVKWREKGENKTVELWTIVSEGGIEQ